MPTEPLISIALCTYNGERFIREQLDSILRQTYQNFEIIAVDDCSTDQTASILSEYAAQDDRFRLHFNAENLGYNQNFQKALRLCEGAFIAICDQDDVWHPEKLRLQVAHINDHELIYHDSEFIDEAGGAVNYRMSDKFNFYRGNQPETFLFLNCVSGHSILMKKSLVTEALPFPKSFHYDQWLALVGTGKGSIDYIDQCLVSYRQHPQNVTDVRALRTKKTSKEQKIERLWQESEWLKHCMTKLPEKKNKLVARLYSLSLQRNTSFLSLPFMVTIWHHQETLLFLLKKNRVSKFFYTLRKAWGQSSKQLS